MGLISFQRMRQRRAAAEKGDLHTTVEGGEIQGIRESGADLNHIDDKVRGARRHRGERENKGIPKVPHTKRENAEFKEGTKRPPGEKIEDTNPALVKKLKKGNQGEGRTVKVPLGNSPATANTSLTTEAGEVEPPVVPGPPVKEKSKKVGASKNLDHSGEENKGGEDLYSKTYTRDELDELTDKEIQDLATERKVTIPEGVSRKDFLDILIQNQNQ